MQCRLSLHFNLVCRHASALVCMPQVLAYWLQMLRWAQAYKAMTCVIAMAQDAIRDAHRPGEESANDEARRMVHLGSAECRLLQTVLAARNGAPFESSIDQDCWWFYCGHVSASSYLFCSCVDRPRSPGRCNQQPACHLEHCLSALP